MGERLTKLYKANISQGLVLKQILDKLSGVVPESWPGNRSLSPLLDTHPTGPSEV